MSDRDGNDHQSMPCGSVSSGLRGRGWGGYRNYGPPHAETKEWRSRERGGDRKLREEVR